MLSIFRITPPIPDSTLIRNSTIDSFPALSNIGPVNLSAALMTLFSACSLDDDRHLCCPGIRIMQYTYPPYHAEAISEYIFSLRHFLSNLKGDTFEMKKAFYLYERQNSEDNYIKILNISGPSLLPPRVPHIPTLSGQRDTPSRSPLSIFTDI